MKRIILVDYAWCLYRFAYVYQNLSVTVEGVTIPTGTLFGSTLLTQSFYAAGENPTQIIFCKDGKPVEREETFKGYKEGRGETESGAGITVDDVYLYQDEIPKILSFLPEVKFAFIEDKEADDLMASLSFDYLEKGYEVIIYSGDNDMLQLVTHGVKITRKIEKKKFLFLGESYVLEKFGVGFDCILQFRSIKGDPSDRIPPVVPRLNTEFVKKFARAWKDLGIEGAFERMGQEDPKNTQKLAASKKELRRNLELMSLVKYKSKQHRLNIQLEDVKPDPALLQKYRLNSFRNFVISRYPELAYHI